MLYNFAATLSLLSGLVLFGLGVLGLTDALGADMLPVTVLLLPSGLGAGPDKVYYAALILLGLWITLCLHVRVPATIALMIVLAKVAFLGEASRIGALPALALTLVLSGLLLRMLTAGSWLKRGRRHDVSESIW